MNISSLINYNLIDLELDVHSKNEALDAMIDMIYENGNLNSKELFKKDVYLREEEGTTGVGMGLAIPHGKSNGVTRECFALGKVKRDLEWNSLDGTPVKLIIMLAVPDVDAATTHIKMLSKLSYYLMDDDFREKLITSTDKEEVIRLINEKEEE